MELIAGFYPRDVEILRIAATLNQVSGGRAAVTPRIIAENSDMANEYASRRLRRLEGGGVFDREDRGLYRLTELGEHIINSETDDDEVDKVERALRAYDDS